MTKHSVLVVDDEPLARRRIVRLLQKLDWVGTISEAGDVDEASALARDTRPDILLLDIQMPGGDGFDVLAGLTDHLPAIVFITAFDHHALRAFDASAVDYVTKPIEPGRFKLAMERAAASVLRRSQAEKVAELNEALAALKRELKTQFRRPPEFWVKSNGEFLRIASEDIIRFQADRDYVRLHVQNRDYLYQESLADLERRLDPADFVRIHRGTIVRRGAIARVKPAPFAALIVVLLDGSEVRVGRTYTAVIRGQLVR
nr:LytTR family DNA-binding domain-containing protein [Hyphomonas sediminis]